MGRGKASDDGGNCTDYLRKRDLDGEFGRALSPREREAVEYACKGLTTKRIAVLMGITLGTCKIHIFNAMHKRGAKNRAQLCVELALEAKTA